MEDIELILATEAAIEYHEREGNTLCAEHFKKQLEVIKDGSDKSTKS